MIFIWILVRIHVMLPLERLLIMIFHLLQQACFFFNTPPSQWIWQLFSFHLKDAFPLNSWTLHTKAA